MEEKASIGPAMVSRLPKFGGRPSTSGTNSLCNGSTQPATPTQDGKATSTGTRPNGLTRPSPFSLKWKRDGGSSSSLTTPNTNGDKAQSLPPLLTDDIKNSSPATPKMRRSGSLMVAVSSPKAIPKQSSKTSPRVGAKFGQSPLNGVSKMGLNGSNIPARTVSESRLMRPMLGSTSPRSTSEDSLSQSNESLKMMTIDNIVRSNSFTHFKQIPSPTCEPIPRSFSFNRAVELAKPLANTQLRPPRSSFLKPPQLSNGRVGLGLNGSLGGSGCPGLGLGGLQHSKSLAVSSSLPTPSVHTAPGTPRALKKPLLPNSVLNKSLTSTVGSSGYRLAQPGKAKQQKPFFPDRVKQDVGSLAAPEYEGLLGIAVDTKPTEEVRKTSTYCNSDESSGNGEGNGGESGAQSCGQTAVETLEDMSLSSASSLDRGDTSEEFLDDIDSVGDVLSDSDLPDNRKCDSSTETPLHSCVNESINWKSENLAEHKEESPMQDSQESLVLSPEQGDAPQASSVELSPSNSSGGTYMWDEEGLEPLGGHGTHPLGCYDDSDFNSMDILNNLNPPGTGDLDDDDLMLDVDLPEDGFHDFNRMSYNERPDRACRQGQRRKHHRYSGPDHFYNNSRAYIFKQYDELNASRISSGPVHPEGRQNDCRPMFDELALEHMTQDCTLLKNQLLRLKTLLQIEEADSTADVFEETEDGTTASQLEVLIKEVQMLREELRSKDKTIAKLTSQCQQLQQQHQQEQSPHQGRQVRCQSQRAPCSLRQSERQLDKRTQHHYDKATQTYWRPPNHAPQILQPFNPCLSEHPHQERLVKTPPTEGPSEVAKRSEETTHVADDRPPEALVADASGAEGSDELSHPPSTNLLCSGSCAPQGVTTKDSPASAAQSAAQHGWRCPAVMMQNSAGLTHPRMLQPLCLRKRVSLPASKPGGTAGFASRRPGCSLGPAANQTKQLPPPSRGLPCFNAGPQLQTPKLCQTSLLQPLRTSEPERDSWRPNSQEEPTRRTLKDLGSVKIMNTLSRSCLPKPKIP